MRFEIEADVLYTRHYEIEAITKAEAMESIKNEEVDYLSTSQVTSPIITHIQEKIQ